ncbi:MAG: T9SS type A sorting domain-containing protein [Ferruginibacter sp.]|nr:T9SS type A sorting domain-containing protein [Ferruginibacter sp.]
MRFVQALTFLLFACTAFAQTPVPMASQPSLTYTENFADIANWSNNFASGNGANRFGAVPAGGVSAIPSATRITANTNIFQVGVPPAPIVSQSGGVHRGSDQTIPTTSIVLLSTGTSENTTSAAIDFFMDFTGVDAGTLSFNWATVFNGAAGSNRNGSLKVYASTDGVSFTDLTAAFVTNFVNYVTASGSITNVALPASFNNSATARLRFYYHNGTGGLTTGSRPKISIDDIKVTAVPNTPCVTPTAQPSNIVFGTITSSSISGSFTAASPAPNSYLVIVSNNNSLTSLPVDGITYNLGDNVGDGYVISNTNAASFSATGLSASTTYYFYVFAFNNVCIGSVKYLTVNPLQANAATIAALPPCTTPVNQPTALNFGTVTVNSIQGSFTAAAATDGYLVLRSTSASLTNNPVSGVSYAPGNILGNATVVQQNNLSAFTATGLSTLTLYYFYIFSYNNIGCSSGPAYNIATPLTGSMSTANLSPCTVPTAQPTSFSSTASGNAIAGSFNAGSGGDAYLVIRSLSPTLSATPVNNTDYNVGDALGGGFVISNNSEKSFLTQNLTPATTYYFYVFAFNKLCSGGSKYLTANPLEGNATTTNDPANNYYFGNLHAHSDYSDGNVDNPGYTPADDYNYAMSSQCMDFLGISEHNHYTSNNNPGNRLSTYGLGITQAANFTIANPSFIALYGMEWGVISNGGHVLIYGDGMDNLWGWETGSGAWGATSNYNEFIAKSDYTGASGLFQTVNNNSATNTFASLAHPDDHDYGDIANIAYNSTFDAAISATAVESGPSTSTNTTYSNPASSMGYLWYYQKLLAKGYHLAPAIDHDNHNTTFGRTTYSRTAVVAPTLSKSNIINGFRNMHVYATQDCDTKVDFTVNTKIMGSSIVAAGAPVIAVNLSDVSTSTAAANIKVMFGVPGSNANAAEIYSVTGSSLLYADNNLANLATGYYYIDITNLGSRIVTAPVWYTRSDLGALPITFSSFTAQRQDKIVKLTWTTEQEINSSHFIIERSADGRNWQSIGTIAAAGNSSQHLEYTAYDNLPLNGINYYRIKEVDKDGRLQVSVVRPVSFDKGYSIMVAPNPAKDFITITLDKFSNSTSTVQLFNASGNLVYTEKTNLSKLSINTSSFTRGLYFIKISNAGEVATQKVLLQ